MRACMARRHKQATSRRVYLSSVRRTEQPESVSRKLEKALFEARRLLIAVIAAELTAAVLVPLAFAERGYSAIGGEWLLILLVGVIVYRAGGMPK